MLQQFVKRVVLCSFLAMGGLFAADTEAPRELTSKELAIIKEEIIPGTKPNISIEKGDYKLTFDGRLKVEGYYEDNAYMLNKSIPDENCYFKETADLNFDFEYGKKKYGYDAVEAYLSIRHKSIWGYALKYADRDSGSSTPISIKMSETYFGQHSHAIGRSLLWLKEAWLRVGLNAIFGNGGTKVHYLQAGWFPFELGRGIALGSFYGANQEFLGLYNYPGDDKSAPGINLNGELVKDTLWYDLYFARFEEHEKNFGDVINSVKSHYIGRKKTPWRGVGKEDDVIAARLQWKPVDNSKYGKLQFEPYVMCDFASDQWIEIDPDAKTTLGAAGLGVEHVWKDLEWGGEIAFNFGQEKLMSIDRNFPKIERDRDTSNLREVCSHILNTSTSKRAGLSDVDPSGPTGRQTAKDAALVEYDPVNNINGGIISGYQIFKNTGSSSQITAEDRFRQGYTNDLRGWMGVIDAAYSWRPYKLKFAATYGYASGDTDPHREQRDKTYHGFIGLNESYRGKRVPSLFMLDMRLLKCPLALPSPDKLPKNEIIDVESDMSFTDIQTLGFGVTWSPKVGRATVDVNPNAIVFWNACDSHKIVLNQDGTAQISPDLARKYFGTEFNMIIKSEIIKDLTLFGNFAMFVPGGYFKDVKGIPLDNDFFNKLAEPVRGDYDPRDFRLGYDKAYHLNIGLDYKF